MIETLVAERARELPSDELALAPLRHPELGRRAGLALVACGIATVAVVAVGLAVVGSNGPAHHVPAPASSDTVAAPPSRGLTIDGPDAVVMHLVTYGPHEASSWHRHTGIHAVAVLSGTLTIYGPDCKPHRFGPGESYVGGQEVHVARNEGDEPLETAVTYLIPTGTALEAFIVPAQAPAGCELA